MDNWARGHHGARSTALAECASGSIFSKIAGGTLTPILLFIYGVKVCLAGEVSFSAPGQGGVIDITGSAAISYAIVFFGLAMLAHFHYLWTPSKRLFRFADLAKGTSLVIIIIATGYMVYDVFAPGMM